MSARRHPGERFGSWTLVERVRNSGWLCRCDCGSTRVRWLSSITSGRSRSCGACHTRRGRPPRKAEPSYRAMHNRLQTDRGPADRHLCVDCVGRASEWSYDGRDPDERMGVSSFGRPIAYSLDAGHYEPRCKPCHTTYDIHMRSARA